VDDIPPKSSSENLGGVKFEIIFGRIFSLASICSALERLQAFDFVVLAIEHCLTWLLFCMFWRKG
jgi:hypothetical protein